ncbi:hypothetical protein [Ottowia sp.]|nr:hypothetical protein [Ottowia sp.]HRN74996.1 hypothetical protein [Ottowia sp.]
MAATLAGQLAKPRPGPKIVQTQTIGSEVKTRIRQRGALAP